MSLDSTPAADFAGLTVAAFESRRGSDMGRLIERLGGVPRVSPSLREAPLGENRAIIDFAHRLITGQVDLVIFMTGVGVRYLIAQIERHVDRQRFIDSLSDIVTVARGPKPVVALKELGLTPTHRVPEPNTWRELLATLDANVKLANLNVAVQEYGSPNPSLVAGLEARGATVERVKVYDYELPDDMGPLLENARALCDGQVDVILFTSAQQAVNLSLAAEQAGLGDRLRAALDRVVVASIGPTTSERLHEMEWPVDLEPSHPKMGHLVQESAQQAADILASKRGVAAKTPSVAARPQRPAAMSAADPNNPWHDSLFLKACRREPVERTPIWLMRQAGRYMSEYRQVREKLSFLELCRNPQLCSEVMCTAVNRLGVDAAILFSDLLPILTPLGLDLEFAKGDGPVIHNPVREPRDVDRVAELEELGPLDFVMQAVRQTRADLPKWMPLIGFAGAPFTLASYVIEGGASRNYLHTKGLMYGDRGAWDALLSKLSRAVTLYLQGQIAAGAQAVQLFDSWVGCLSPDDYRTFVLPHVKSIIDAMPPQAPVIHFGTGNPQLLPLQAEAGGTVIGLDWRVRLDDGWRLAGPDRAVQGNLDPAILMTDKATIRRRAGEVLAQAGNRPGHIFNVGHGIMPQTPVDNVIALVEAVRELSAR